MKNLKKVLLLGNQSFVASGLYEKLKDAGFHVECFSRGKEKKVGDFITGNVLELSKNQYLDSHYDFVINFILLKDCDETMNLEYIKEVVKFCKLKLVKTLFQISSIMVYDNCLPYINKNTEIEYNTKKKGYAALKISVDKYLNSLKNIPFFISFVRLGYVLDEITKVPFIIELPFVVCFLKGDKKSIMPVVYKHDVHRALVNLLKLNYVKKVYLFTPSHNQTKYHFAKSQGFRVVLFLPKEFALFVAKILMKLHLIPISFYKRIEGMYIYSKYDSSMMEKLLKGRF